MAHPLCNRRIAFHLLLLQTPRCHQPRPTCVSPICFHRPSVASPRTTPRGAQTDLVLVSFSPPRFASLSPSSKLPRVLSRSGWHRRPHLSSGGRAQWAKIVARGGDQLGAATAYLVRKLDSEHTDDFLASCAVVVSSLLPPFAKTKKCNSRIMQCINT